MRRQKVYSVMRGLVRLSWNKTNLYNLAVKSRRLFDGTRRTVFQQQWKAKRETRAYHDSHTTERSWLRMFQPRLPTLNIQLSSSNRQSLRKAAAQWSASSQAALSKDQPQSRIAQLIADEKLKQGKQHPSAASLMYAPMERRVDFILFRSHFSSSVYMARQTVRHGKVTVNGKKVDIPSYRVQDGDVVQVDPKAVCTLEKSEGGQGLAFKPRPFMQPWMFIPDYLEVNYNTCSTVFLREPLTRPGRTELPSPFPPEVQSLAYEFYVNKSRAFK
ncbi:hypothetical protein H4R34_003342 [Dimargaris verticillata]|uniref:RNA-binding S4 domain-containing protein n=1 Tax=Dimargaris verticillata TaxID=2761393 RepID=A0A9W8B6F1_9FUNG|nr:hypothetical protein H4R34_003342 [Dimargaris verticillata]